MDKEQEEKQRLEIERQHYADWLASAEPRHRGSATFQKRAKAAAFAYARDAVISATPGPVEASLSEVERSAVADAVDNEGDEIELTRNRLSDESDLSAMRREERRISNLLIKRSARNDPEKMAREREANSQARSVARLADPEKMAREQEANSQARSVARLADPEKRAREQEANSQARSVARLADPEKRAREQEANSQSRSVARLADPEKRAREQEANSEARSLARQSPDVRSHERVLEREGRIENEQSLSRYRSQTREIMGRRRMEFDVLESDARYSHERRANAKQIRQHWDIDNPCLHCGRIWLKSSEAGLRRKCCRNGDLWDINSPFILEPLPYIQEKAFELNSPIVKASNQYNNILSLGAVGIDNDKVTPGWDVITGAHSVRLSGKTYHYIAASNTRGGIQYFLHDGRNEQLAAHGRERDVDVPTLELIFEFMQQHNVLCKQYAAIGAMAQWQIADLESRSELFSPENLNDLIPQLSRATVEFDVSSIMIDRSTGNHVLRVCLKGSHGSSSIASTSEIFEPIGYPMLFPYGENGWGKNFCSGQRDDGSNWKVTFPDYLASRMLMPERHLKDCFREMEPSPEDLADPNFGKFGRYCEQIGGRRFFMPTNRFQRNSRLGQVYLVDQMSRAIDFRLDYHRNSEAHIFGGQSRNSPVADDSDDEGEQYGDDQGAAYQGLDPRSRPTFLSDSFTGSKRHMKKQATNALHVVAEKGSSHIFATLTTNKNWPEFREVVWPDSDVFDMPDIVVEVFHARLQAFLHNLRNGHYFGGDSTVFIIRVIEYQERGLPHAHIVFRLEGAATTITANYERLMAAYGHLSEAEKAEVPVPTMDDAAALWVDDHICAERPIDPRLPENQARYAHLGPDYTTKPEYKDDLRLFLGIEKFHIHKHSGSHLVNGCLDKNGVCKKGFMKNIVREKTSFSKEGLPLYRRRSVQDLDVVPYNRQIYLDWDGHCNIEFSGLTYTVLYLYKYLFKGPSKVDLSLLATPPRPGVLPLHPKDEIGRYIRGRRLCSMDAMWRLFGFHNYPRSEPAVIGVKVRLPQFVKHYDDKQLLLQIVVYFARPHQLAGVLFAQMFSKYRTVREEPSAAWKDRNRHEQNAWFRLDSLCGHYGPKGVWLIKRLDSRRQEVLCRLHTVAYSSGDLWFCRLLLKLFPFRNFRDMKTFQGVEYDSFQEVAVVRKVTNDAKECVECFTNACLDASTPRQLRGLFVTMAINAFPVLVIFRDEVLCNQMLEITWIDNPRYDNPEVDRRLATEKLLCDLRDRFAEHGKTNTDYGLPEPADSSTELQRYQLHFGNVAEQARLYADLKAAKPLNAQQQHVFDVIAAAILSQGKTADATIFTLEGSGGCGKTELAKQILAYIRSTPPAPGGRPKSIHTVCSTALGAQNYPQGECSTAHSFFVLPVEEEYEKEVDEIHEMKCNAARKPERLELIQNADAIIWDEALANHRECLEAVMREFDNFRGKVLILMFDAKQLLPVVPGGDHLDIVKASLFSSPHWVKFQRHLLIENMRLQHIADPLEQRLQVAYDMMIRGIGENTEVEGLVIADELLENEEESPTHKRFTLMGIPAQNLFNADFDPHALQAALAWLYPGGYSPDHAAKNVVLATTNALVDEWNDIIAALNPNPEHEPLFSKDTFADVDDDHGHLKQMISDEVLQKYNTNDVPPHKLILKVGDVCLIMRNLNVDDGVTNNTRVVILKITKRYISCQTIGSRPVNILLPRIRFNFRLPYGQSFTMTRLQFPLRRAFCLSIHKSQGQTLQRALIDARGGFFAHGHLYVAMSRVTRYDCIAFFLAHHQFYFSPGYFFGPGENMHNKPFLANIVYPEAIQEIQNLAQAHQGGLA